MFIFSLTTESGIEGQQLGWPVFLNAGRVEMLKTFDPALLLARPCKEYCLNNKYFQILLGLYGLNTH